MRIAGLDILLRPILRMLRPIALLAVLVPLLTHGQRFYFENISVQEGLPAQKVNTVLQDSSGLVWIGTEAGLASYDGVSVTAFASGDELAPNGVRSLLLDRDQHLWAGHLGGGLSRFDGLRWHVVQLQGVKLSTDVTGITQDSTGAIWIGTFGEGVLRFSPGEAGASPTAERIEEAQGANAQITGVVRLRDGRVCVLDATGAIQQWNTAASRFEPLTVPGVTDMHQVTALYQDRSGSLWIGTTIGGAFRQDARTGMVEVFDLNRGLPSSIVLSFGEDADGRIWIGTWDSGIARVDARGVRRFTAGNGLHGNSVRCLASDREGNMLIGTTHNGMDVFKGERFQNFGEDDGLMDREVWSVVEDKEGRIWFGTSGGIGILDPDETSTARVKTLSMQQGKLTSNRVRSLRIDQRGQIWVGTETGGLLELEPSLFRANAHEELSPYIPELKVTALEVGLPGELWVGTLRGLVRVLPGSGQIPNVYLQADGLAGDNVSALYRDPEGTLWVGCTSAGISRIDNGIAKAIALEDRFTPTCFVQDAEGRLWVGTEGQGLIILKNDRIVEHHSMATGLLSNSVRSIALDGQDHLWIGTTKGLNKWRPKVEGFLSFTDRSGFTGIEAKLGAVCRTEGGDLWFGTANGATRVLAAKGADRMPPPSVALRELKVNLEERIAEPDLSLSHTERNLRFTYGCVSLSDPGAVRYQYQLKGLDTDWQPVTEETTASYPALPPGGYTFRVKAINRAGVWSEPLEYAFLIHPPWYRSWWFYTLLAFTIGLALFSFIKVRERQLRLRNQILEKRVEERTAEVVAQSNEIEGQKVRIEDLLLNILPKEISEELKEKGKATARRHEEVSVLFTDMKGFTKAAEKMTPEELVNELDECFIHFDEIVGRYGIEKIKTIGDSYMCAAGVPTRDAHHAYKCALAALEVRDLMEEQRQQREAQGKDPWILRIGVHTGPVVAGVVGRRKFAYDIWGDTVNTASRMESSGEPGEVNISGTTYALVKDRFECEHRGQVEAKNKGAIDMYFVRRIKEGWCSDPKGHLPNERFLKEIGLAVTQDQLA